jgi:hypothetical protein
MASTNKDVTDYLGTEEFWALMGGAAVAIIGIKMLSDLFGGIADVLDPF